MSKKDASDTVQGGPEGGVMDFAGPPPEAKDDPKARGADAPKEAPKAEARKPADESPKAAKGGDASEIDRLRRELAEKDELLRRMADQEEAGRERADALILPRAYKITSHAMKRHPRGTILRPDQFPPGVLERMKREGRVRPVFNLPEGQAMTTEAGKDAGQTPARGELPRAEDRAPSDQDDAATR